jgi:hypothetical protein
VGGIFKTRSRARKKMEFGWVAKKTLPVVLLRLKVYKAELRDVFF